MPTVSLSKETMRKLKSFRKIMETILAPEDMPKTDSETVEVVVSIGLDRMLQDVIPKGENVSEVFRNTMTTMFNENPEFLCDFVSDTLKKGEQIQKNQAEEARKQWRRMYA